MEENDPWIQLSIRLDYSIRQIVAGNPSTPPETLALLIADRDNIICERLAENPSTPPEILRVLANYKNLSIINALANNINTPPEVRLLKK